MSRNQKKRAAKKEENTILTILEERKWLGHDSPIKENPILEKIKQNLAQSLLFIPNTELKDLELESKQDEGDTEKEHLTINQTVEHTTENQTNLLSVSQQIETDNSIEGHI